MNSRTQLKLQGVLILDSYIKAEQYQGKCVQKGRERAKFYIKTKARIVIVTVSTHRELMGHYYVVSASHAYFAFVMPCPVCRVLGLYLRKDSANGKRNAGPPRRGEVVSFCKD